MTLKPVITEKATKLADRQDRPIYTFAATGLTKAEVIKWIKKEHKVTPVKVAMINLPVKQVARRGQKMGHRGGLRKALVYLKKGEKLTLA